MSITAGLALLLVTTGIGLALGFRWRRDYDSLIGALSSGLLTALLIFGLPVMVLTSWVVDEGVYFRSNVPTSRSYSPEPEYRGRWEHR